MSESQETPWGDWGRRLRSEPPDSEVWSGFADWLTGRCDARGELIALSRRLAAATGRDERRQLERQMLALEERHRASWTDGLDAALHGHARWWNGFLVAVDPFAERCGVERGWPAELRALIAHPSACLLEEIIVNFGRGFYEPDDAQAFVQTLQRTALTRLTVKHGRSSHAPLATALAACPGVSSLKSLAIGYTFRSYPGVNVVEPIVTSPHLTQLEVLDLQWARLDDEGAAVLASESRLTSLQALLLPRNEIGDEGALALARSPGLSSLQRLDLSNNAIGARGASALLHSPHLRGLRELSLANNQIEAIEPLPEHTRGPALTRLDLRGNQLRDSDVSALLEMLSGSERLHLDLTRNPIGAPGACLLEGRPEWEVALEGR